MNAKKWTVSIVTTVSALCLTLAGCSTAPPLLAEPPAGEYRVTRIIDGDTLEIAIPAKGYELRQRVRLVGFDAPERGQVGFVEATAKLAEQIGPTVRIAYPLKRTRDKYGRLLCTVD